MAPFSGLQHWLTNYRTCFEQFYEKFKLEKVIKFSNVALKLEMQRFLTQRFFSVFVLVRSSNGKWTLFHLLRVFLHFVKMLNIHP